MGYKSGACTRTMGCTEWAEMASLPIPCPPTVRLLSSIKAYGVYAIKVHTEPFPDQ